MDMRAIDTGWTPIRNWLWATGVLALFPMTGLIDPGPIATALLLPFAISIVMLGAVAIFIGSMAILLGLLR